MIRAFLVHFHTAILRHSSESFNFTNGSIGVWTGCVDRVWVWVKLWSSSVDPMVLGYAVWGGYGCLGRAEEEKGSPPIWTPYPGLHAGNWVRTPHITAPPAMHAFSAQVISSSPARATSSAPSRPLSSSSGMTPSVSTHIFPFLVRPPALGINAHIFHFWYELPPYPHACPPL